MHLLFAFKRGAYLFCLLLIHFGAMAAPVTYWTGKINTDWNDAENWDNGLPVGLIAIINPLNYNGGMFEPTIGSNSTSTPIEVDVEDGATLIISANLSISGHFVIAGAGSLVSVTAGAISISTGNQLSVTSGGELRVSGGSITAAGTAGVWVQDNNSKILLSGGVINAGNDLTVTTGSTMSVSGTGDLNVTGAMTISDKGTASTAVTVSGGTVDLAGTLTLGAGSSCNSAPSLTVSSGTLTINGMLQWQKTSSLVCGISPNTFPQVTVSGGILILVSGTEREDASGTDVAMNILISSGVLECRSSIDMGQFGDVLNQTGGLLRFTAGAVKWFNGGAYNATAGEATIETDVALVAGSGGLGSWQFYDLYISGVSGFLNIQDPDINVSGLWDCSASFNNNGKRVTFNGSDLQVIASGDQPFYDVTIANTSATIPQIALKGYNIQVENNLTMTSGKVNLNSLTLTLGTSGVSLGTLTYTDGWLYGGRFKRWLNSTFLVGNVAGLFPMGGRDGLLGANNYRPFWYGYGPAIVSPTGGTMTVTHTAVYPAKYTPALYTDLSWGFAVQGVSESTWDVTTADGFGFTGSACIRFGGEGFGTNVLTDLNACLSASAIATHGAATGTATVPYVNRIGLAPADLVNSWRIGSKNITQSPLPIELLSFDAKFIENEVQTKWITATEVNNDYFTVERSVDGLNFESVGVVDGGGNSSVVISC